MCLDRPRKRFIPKLHAEQQGAQLANIHILELSKYGYRCIWFVEPFGLQSAEIAFLIASIFHSLQWLLSWQFYYVGHLSIPAVPMYYVLSPLPNLKSDL